MGSGLPDCIRVVNGRKALKTILESYVRELYQYNSVIKDTGFYLKPVHIVVKKTSGGKRYYYYYGRYWWRIVYAGKKGRTSRVKWKYYGKSKPRELAGYPDPPRNPLEGVKVVVEGDDIIVSIEQFNRIKRFLHGYRAVPVQCKE